MPVDETEPQRVAEAVKRLRLKYVVLTSVTRDDLETVGAPFSAKWLKRLKRLTQIRK